MSVAARIQWTCAFLLLAGSGAIGLAQTPTQQGEAQLSPSARESAQADLTGYWVPLITEDWLWRSITRQHCIAWR